MDAIGEDCKSVNERNKSRANIAKSLEPKRINSENAKFF
jgi:hypothetical protein